MSDVDVMRLFAMWMLAHEQADELMKAAVARGADAAREGMASGPDAFTDGLMAMIAEEKDRLKAGLAGGGALAPQAQDERLEELRFEVGELRGRLDQMQASLDAIAAHLGASQA
jgi:hypothetical protein